MRRFSYWQQLEIAKQMKELLRIGVVSPCESKWAAKKKDGSIRVVFDSRGLNRVIVKDSYPMGNVQNILGSVCGSKKFTNTTCFWDTTTFQLR